MGSRRKPKATVLVLGREPVIASLLGMMLEMAGYVPAYPAAGERPEEALARIRPPLVVLLDGGTAAARSDIFLARAAKARARVVLFGPPSEDDGEPLATLARSRGLAHVTMPCDPETLAAALDGSGLATHPEN